MTPPPPADLAERRVWADEVGGERGELVALMCDLSTLDAPPSVRAPLRKRMQVLLDAHGDTWSGLGSLVTERFFRSGFVEVVRVKAATLLENAEKLFTLAPALRGLIITDVTLEEGDPVALLRRVLALPQFRSLESLCIDIAKISREIGRTDHGEIDTFEQNFPDESIAVFGESGLRPPAFEFRETFTGLGALGANGALTQLRALATYYFAPEILSWCPHLEALEVSSGPLQLDIEWPATLRELRLSASANDVSLKRLSDSPLAARIRRLRIGGHHPYTELGGFRSLRSLDAWDSSDQNGVRRALLRAELPELRELRLGTQCSLDDVREVLRVYGPQLEFADLPSMRRGNEEELRSMVAGAVRVGPHVRPTIPLLAGRTDFEPWL